VKIDQTRIAQQCPCCTNSDLSSSPAILMPFISHRAFNWTPVEIDDSWGLNSIKNGYAYSICNSLLCKKCGFLFLDIRFTDDETSRLYANYREEEYTKLRDFYEPGYAARNDDLNIGYGQKYVKDIECFLKPHLELPVSILDWGGDTGKNTPFKDKNKLFDIYDISNNEPIEEAKIISKEEAYTNEYDLIICSNVLEHVAYPHKILEEIIPCMDNDSLLYIEVPHENLIINEKNNLHLKKKHWHEHINFYTLESLKSLIDNSGLELIDVNDLEVTNGTSVWFQFQLACKLK